MSDVVQPQEVVFEHHRIGDSIGIEEARPRLSWRFFGHEKDWRQESYELRIKSSGSRTEEPIDYEETFRSAESVLVPWPCRALASRESATVQVRVTSGSSSSSWSPPSNVEIGLLERDDWSAEMIAAPRTISTSGSLRPALLRKEFELAGKVRSARLYVTAYGIYEATINGQSVGDHVLAPGWTSYKYHLNYQTFDVTALLVSGSNAIGAEVGEGWYSGRMGYDGGKRFMYGDVLALLAQLEITLEDGSQAIIGSDQTWKSWISPRISSEIYDGEIYDARSEILGWESASFDDTAWSAVTVLEHPFWCQIKKLDDDGNATTEQRRRLQSPQGPPVRRLETVSVKEILVTPAGSTVLDFGQVLVGWLRVRVQGPPGHTVIFKHVEVLENGEIAIRPLRDCNATDTLILDGNEIAWEPKFTFHGFRYVQVDNWPSADSNTLLEDIEAIVVHTDMERTGWFSSSDTGSLGVNKLHENIVWSMKGNFVSIPTDCPQRDERMGWTGDIQVFCPTASFLYDTAGMLSGWLRDLAIEQEQEMNGVVADVAPMVPGITSLTAKAAWADAAIIVPWALYHAFSDLAVLSAQLESMKMWLEKGMPRQTSSGDSAKGLWDPSQFQYGDWLDPDAPPDDAGAGKTDPQFVANAYLGKSRLHVTCQRNSTKPGCSTCRVLVVQGVRSSWARESGRCDPIPVRSSSPEDLVPTGICHGQRPSGPRDHDLSIPSSSIRPSALLSRRRHRRATPLRRRLAARGHRARLGLQDRHWLRRHASRPAGAHARRQDAAGLPHVAGRRVPELAVPADHGRHDAVGALGLAAALGRPQPGGHDLFQPLRARQRRGLAAFPRRRHQRPRARVEGGAL